MSTQLPPERAVELLKTMLRMRRLEEQVIHLVEDHKQISGHYHVYIGQESAGATVCSLLRPEDYVFTTHRNHAHILAKGGDPNKILAEIIGKTDGYSHGRAGTFHVAAPQLGVLHTSAVVGGCLPLAAGAAYGSKLKADGRATVVFFGDGAMEEGAFYETMNIARLWELPVFFYMENNAVSPQQRPGRGSPTSEHSATALSDIPRAFNIDTFVVDGTDVAAVHELVSNLVPRLQAGQGPFFVESRTSRWPGNYGAYPTLVGGDTDIRWSWEAEQAPEVVRAWERDSDPVLLFARKLLAEGRISRGRLEELDRAVNAEMAAAAQFALNSPYPAPEAVLEHAYA
jgi:TPP-dependent pyruvate/acetoin dehydrogenase alpha subunit